MNAWILLRPLLKSIHTVNHQRVVVRLKECKLAPIFSLFTAKLLLEHERERFSIWGPRPVRLFFDQRKFSNWLPGTFCGWLLIHPYYFHAFFEQQGVHSQTVDSKANHIGCFYITHSEPEPALFAVFSWTVICDIAVEAVICGAHHPSIELRYLNK